MLLGSSVDDSGGCEGVDGAGDLVPEIAGEESPTVLRSLPKNDVSLASAGAGATKPLLPLLLLPLAVGALVVCTGPLPEMAVVDAFAAEPFKSFRLPCEDDLDKAGGVVSAGLAGD